MNQNKLVAIFRQVLAEHENGALGGIDLAEALAQAVSTSPPTHEQIEAAAKAMGEASSGFFSEGSWRHLAREALAAAVGAAPQAPRQGIAEVVPTREGVSCQQGLCPKWCSHLMWACERCSSEGGWGGRREWLDAIVARHKCALERIPVQEDEAILAEQFTGALAETPWFPAYWGGKEFRDAGLRLARIMRARAR